PDHMADRGAGHVAGANAAKQIERRGSARKRGGAMMPKPTRPASPRGAGLVRWLPLTRNVFFGVHATLASCEPSRYPQAGETARSREALYLAEGGLAKALSQAREGTLIEPRVFEYAHGAGQVTVRIETGGDAGGMLVRSSAVIRQAQREWRESVSARISGAG